METTSFTYKTGPCSDVLIIGGGLAGMYSALAAAESGAAVRILCKSKTGGSGNSVVAMSVHRFAPDAPGLREDYRRRFLASGAGQQDAELAAFFVDHAAAAMERLRGLGLPLEYRTLSENGGEYPYLACCSPKQGRILTKAVREKLNEYPNIAVEDGVTVCDILTENGRAQGVLALCGGEMRVYPAKTMILCCGGAGNVYAATSNTRDVTGDGYAMAARCGLPLRGMEFVQFYPYRIYSPKRADIFPDLFDHGAVLRNEKGERFMDCAKYPMKTATSSRAPSSPKRKCGLIFPAAIRHISSASAPTSRAWRAITRISRCSSVRWRISSWAACRCAPTAPQTLRASMPAARSPAGCTGRTVSPEAR